MKKMLRFGGRKKFDQGGVARSSDGQLIRFGYEDDDEYQKRVNADKAAQGRKSDVEFSGRTTPRDAVEKAVDDLDAYNAGPPRKPEPDKPEPDKPEPVKPEPAKLKTEDTDEADRRREEISKLPQKNKPNPVKKKTEESKPPAGAFRGTRSEGGNYLPSSMTKSSKTENTDESDRRREAIGNLLKKSSPVKKSSGRESMFSTGSTKLRDITAGKMSRFAKGGSVGSASKRGDGIAQRGKTRGKMY